jgi:hypothetical protein
LPPTHFVLSLPSGVTAGDETSLTVTAADSTGATVSRYAGTIHFTSSDAGAALPADYTFTSADAGSHTFTVKLTTAGSQTISATDSVLTGLTGTSEATIVSPGQPSALAVLSTSLATPGAPISVTVTATDAYGNVTTGYTGSIHFTSSDSLATLPSNYTFTGSDDGTHTFSATLRTKGIQTVSAMDLHSASMSGSDSSEVGGITITTGWNLLDLPLQDPTISSLGTLIAALNEPGQLGSGAVSVATVYTGGRFAMYLPGYSQDQALAPTQGVYVLSTVSGTWTPSGSAYSGLMRVPLEPGWNLVAFPSEPNGLMTSTIVQDVQGSYTPSPAPYGLVREIAVYGGGPYQTYIPGVSRPLAAQSTRGLWIQSSSEVVWVWDVT